MPRLAPPSHNPPAMPPTLSSQDKLRQGHALQMQGKYAEATTLYREVLSAEPRNAPALHLLGVLVMQTGQVEQGVGLIREALALLPGFAPAHGNLARGLEMLGRKDEALASYGRVIALAPGFAEAHANRARILESLGRYDEALKDFDKALSLKQDAPVILNRGAVLLQLGRTEEALAEFDRAAALGFAAPLLHFNRGVALAALDRQEEALASYDRAIAANPDYAEAHANRALVLERLGRIEDALAGFDQALARDPNLHQAALNRAGVLPRLGRHQEALEALDALIAARPDIAHAYNNRGTVRKALGALDAALEDFDRAIAFNPGDAEMRASRATTLQALGRFDDALAAFDLALSLAPDSRRILFNKSVLLLLLGRFSEGLPLYELRQNTPPPGATGMSWQGEDLTGKRLLVYSDQGMGDAILYGRYLRLVQDRGAHVLFLAPSAMTRLLSELVPPVELLRDDAPLPACDAHVSLTSLPHFLGTTLETIPAAASYLKAEPELAEKWRKKIGKKGFRIGLNWKGKTGGDNDPFRSFPLAALAPLARVPGVRLISLQKGDGVAELDGLPEGMTVETLGEDFDSGPDAFIDSAAVMEALDLVVTCDTSIAHLAGALGRPVWVGLKHVPEWRWQLGRTDSPWYPGMTLFRQAGHGDWHSVFAAMAARLASDIAKG